MAVACPTGSGPNDSGGGGVRLVERIRTGLATWCADGEAEYGDPEHIWHGESFCCTGPEQTAEFVRAGYERLARWTAVVALLLFAAIGFGALCRGVEQASSQQANRPAVQPSIGPLPSMPPINTGGCMATIGTDYVRGF